MNNFYSFKKIDDKAFQITEYDTCDCNFRIKIKYSSIFLVIIICIVIVNIYCSYKQNSDKIEDVQNSINEFQNNYTEFGHNFPFSDDGFVLPNSSNSYLIVDNLIDLNNRAKKTEYSYSMLLRYAVNEIYARHGYLFYDKELYAFYSQYKWYNDLPKVEEVQWGEMNEFEQSNLTLLLNEENQ